MTTVPGNRGTVLAYVAALNAGDFDSLPPLFTADAEIHGVAGAGPIDVAMPIWRQLHEGLNMQLEVLDIVEDTDRVVVRYRETGRWTGPFLGFDRPTGLPYDLPAIEWFEMQDGRIRRRWGVRDSGTQARQVGMLAGPAGKAA